MKKCLKGLLLAVFALLFALSSVSGLCETWDSRILTAADTLAEGETYTDLDHVAAYLVFYGELPANYITKAEARSLGWSADQDLWAFAEGYSLGGDEFQNREGLLPPAEYHECDLYYSGGERGDERLVYSDEEIYYTGDRYASFVFVYPSEEEALIENAPKPSPSPSPTPKRTASPTPRATATPQPKLSVEKNGTYTDKEHVALYIHLYGKDQVRFDWKGMKLDAFGGKTAFEVADAAWQCHTSQYRKGKYEVYTEGPYDSQVFGLYRSRVGADALHGDFFENLPEKGTAAESGGGEAPGAQN